MPGSLIPEQGVRNPLRRLLKRTDFLRVAAARRKWAAPGLVLQAAPVPVHSPADGKSTGTTAIRVGFTTSKKVGNAVERNRARRRLRAAVAELFPLWAAPGRDYVVIGRRETLTRPYSLLLQDLRGALKRVGALRSDDSAGLRAPPFSAPASRSVDAGRQQPDGDVTEGS